jgi:hypothetical protein
VMRRKADGTAFNVIQFSTNLWSTRPSQAAGSPYLNWPK